MKTTYILGTLVSLSLLSIACSESTKFKGTPQKAEIPKGRSIDALPTSTPLATKPQPLKLSLDVILPINEIRSGAKPITAVANVKNALSDEVIWKVIGPADIDVGVIDENGVYTSPQTLQGEIDVQIVAFLKENSTIWGSATLKIVPAEQIFVGCKVGSKLFPILAEVYKIPRNTMKIPTFEDIKADQATTVCMDSFNVPARNFNEGFPGVADLSEWFALHTATKIKITESGTYTFRLNSDDGSILKIDGHLIIDNDGTHAPELVDGKAELSEGVHDLVLDYFQGPAEQIALELFWKTPSSEQFVIIPPSAFQK